MAAKIKEDHRLIIDRLLAAGVRVPVIETVMAGFASRRWIYARRQELTGNKNDAR